MSDALQDPPTFFVAVSLQAIEFFRIPAQSRLPASGRKWRKRDEQWCDAALFRKLGLRPNVFATVLRHRDMTRMTGVQKYIAPIHTHDPYTLEDPILSSINKNDKLGLVPKTSGHLNLVYLWLKISAQLA